MEIYRVTGDSPSWQKKAYDYARMDAFCIGQGIPVEMEFAHDEPEETLQAVVLIEDHKPVAGCRISFPQEDIGKIGRVCVVRERQKSGVGRQLIREAEDWIEESGVRHIVISSQDRAAGFYHKVGYVTNPEVDPEIYEHRPAPRPEDRPGEPRPELGFRCVLVEKYL